MDNIEPYYLVNEKGQKFYVARTKDELVDMFEGLYEGQLDNDVEEDVYYKIVNEKRGEDTVKLRYNKQKNSFSECCQD
jgi:hypothetical protein